MQQEKTINPLQFLQPSPVIEFQLVQSKRGISALSDIYPSKWQLLANQPSYSDANYDVLKKFGAGRNQRRTAGADGPLIGAEQRGKKAINWPPQIGESSRSPAPKRYSENAFNTGSTSLKTTSEFNVPLSLYIDEFKRLFNFFYERQSEKFEAPGLLSGTPNWSIENQLENPVSATDKTSLSPNRNSEMLSFNKSPQLQKQGYKTPMNLILNQLSINDFFQGSTLPSVLLEGRALGNTEGPGYQISSPKILQESAVPKVQRLQLLRREVSIFSDSNLPKNGYSVKSDLGGGNLGPKEGRVTTFFPVLVYGDYGGEAQRGDSLTELLSKFESANATDNEHFGKAGGPPFGTAKGSRNRDGGRMGRLQEGNENLKPGYPNSPGRSGRAVTINVNKPLIDYFTIHVQDAATGLTGFKQKVEQAMIEILSSIG